MPRFSCALCPCDYRRGISLPPLPPLQLLTDEILAIIAGSLSPLDAARIHLLQFHALIGGGGIEVMGLCGPIGEGEFASRGAVPNERFGCL